jgi:hypothetical protein
VQIVRVSVAVRDNEYDALAQDAARNYRDTRKHARYLICEALRAAGLLNDEEVAGQLPTVGVVRELTNAAR